MNKTDKYQAMEDSWDMNQGMGMNPYMGMPNMPMMHMYPSMMPNMPMPPMMNMQSMMPMYPMQGMGMQPMMMTESLADEDYVNYMVNMNKYMAHMLEAEAYRLQAMEYMKKMEK